MFFKIFQQKQKSPSNLPGLILAPQVGLVNETEGFICRVAQSDGVPTTKVGSLQLFVAKLMKSVKNYLSNKKAQQ